MELKNINRRWWKEAVVYQIYPRSFQDSNGDGVGDLRGIINRLDYIKSLGVDVIWLNPCFKSPNDDNGYDISDYRDIMDDFGTMADFDELLEGVHARGMKVILDLVVNHTSDEHQWFVESRKSRDNPYRDYYHWWPAENGKPPNRWSFFDKDGSAWKYDAQTDAYYLHYFAEKQPDLNWENPKVRAEVYDMMHFWLKKGIDGFRMDVITFISKHDGYPDFPAEYHSNSSMAGLYAQGPRLHQYLHEMNREVLQHYDIMTVAEGPGTTTDNVLDLVAEDRQELDMSYHFDHQKIGTGERHVVTDDWQNLIKFKDVMTRWDQVFTDKGWNTVYLTNHDHPRMVSRWASDAPEWRAKATKMLTTFLLSMRGTPYWYMGDEIGMTNIRFDSIEQYNDLMTINWYNLTKAEGGDIEYFLESHKATSRDNARTPVQWDTSENAGFTSGKPWLTVNPNYLQLNVAVQDKDPDSELNYFRRMTALRKQNLTLIYGSYELLLPDHEQVYAYLRELDGERLLVLLNFSDQPASAQLPGDLSSGEILITNEPGRTSIDSAFTLAPFEALIARL